jgi:hypothetical protein
MDDVKRKIFVDSAFNSDDGYCRTYIYSCGGSFAKAQGLTSKVVAEI